jgi:recombination protein RecT
MNMADIVKTTNNGGVQKRPPSLADLLQQSKSQIALALPKHLTPDRMARLFLTALRTTPKLAQCTPDSFLASIMTLAQLGLEPNTPLGQAYLIPRKNNKRGGVMEDRKSVV